MIFFKYFRNVSHKILKIFKACESRKLFESYELLDLVIWQNILIIWISKLANIKSVRYFGKIFKDSESRNMFSSLREFQNFYKNTVACETWKLAKNSERLILKNLANNCEGLNLSMWQNILISLQGDHGDQGDHGHDIW